MRRTCLAAALLYLVPEIGPAGYAAAVGAVTLAGLAACLVLSFRYLAAIAGGKGDEGSKG